MLYFSVHPNGEREVVTIMLRPRPHLKRLRFDIDMGDMLIKARSSAGNRVTKEIIQKITQKEVGGSTLAACKIWYDPIVSRLNDDNRGTFLGSFKGADKILTLYKTGEYRLTNFDISNHFDEDMIHIEKWHPERSISAVYYDSEKEMHYVKRFLCEITSDKKVSFISESEGSFLHVVSTAYRPVARIVYNKLLKETQNLPDNILQIADIIETKGLKAQGNQVSKLKVKEIVLEHPIEGVEPWPEDEIVISEDGDSSDESDDDDDNTIEWDMSDDDQPKLF
jgi:topoisomerase-4 subunit A